MCSRALQQFSFHLFAKRPVERINTCEHRAVTTKRRVVGAAGAVRRASSRGALFSFVEFQHLVAREACAVFSLDMNGDAARWEEAVAAAVKETRRMGQFGLTQWVEQPARLRHGFGWRPWATSWPTASSWRISETRPASTRSRTRPLLTRPPCRLGVRFRTSRRWRLHETASPTPSAAQRSTCLVNVTLSRRWRRRDRVASTPSTRPPRVSGFAAPSFAQVLAVQSLVDEVAPSSDGSCGGLARRTRPDLCHDCL